MSQNLVVLNESSTATAVHESPFKFQTVTRPILIQHEFSEIAQIPMLNLASNKPVLVQVEVLVEKAGVWTKVGSTQISGKDFESTVSNTYFTFDVSSILSSEIKSGFVPNSYNTQNSIVRHGLNHQTNPGFSYVIKYKTQARSWYRGLSGDLVLNEESPALESKVKRACNIYFHPKFKSPSKYANTPLDNSVGGAVSDNHFMSQVTSSAPQLNNKKFLTNCPTSLVRKICLNMPLSLSATNTHEDVPNYAPKLAFKYSTSNGTPLSSQDELVIPGAPQFPQLYGNDEIGDEYGSGNIATAYVNPTGVADLLNISQANIDPLIRFYLAVTYFPQGGSSTLVDDNIGFGSLDFKLHNQINNPTGNYLPNINKNSCFIYFVNDFNVLDYFAFTGEVDIVHEHSKQTFKTGYKDYTSRHNSNFGVSRGSTVEIYTCREIVNKETSEWLAEIYRSKEVYLWSVEEHEFIPIQVLDGETQVSYGNKLELQPFSLSFIKDTHIIKN